MRRTTAATIGTLAGTALLLGARLAVGSAPPPAVDELAAPVPEAAAAPPAGAPPGAAGGSATPAGPTRSATPGARAATRPSATARKPARTAAATTAAARPRSGLRDGTFAGAPDSNRYGTIKVTISVSGGRLTGISASYPTSPSETRDINARAIPRLKQEALAAQSARIATVSGATYTSDSFAASLQSALTAARA